jgi:hypothetical protein
LHAKVDAFFARALARHGDDMESPEIDDSEHHERKQRQAHRELG